MCEGGEERVVGEALCEREEELLCSRLCGRGRGCRLAGLGGDGVEEVLSQRGVQERRGRMGDA